MRGQGLHLMGFLVTSPFLSICSAATKLANIVMQPFLIMYKKKRISREENKKQQRGDGRE